jgi:limonene-1,2-epoxide hydrolase
MIKDNAVATGRDAKEIVLKFIDALNSHDYDTARNYLNDNMTFVGVLGARNGADAYMDDMSRMKFEYDIRKTFADDNDVCLFYDINMAGKTIFCSGWYHLEEGKISTFRVVFDPRPVLGN